MLEQFPLSSGSNVGVSPSIDVQSHVLTPTDQLDGDPLLLARRSSSGALLSPDVLEQIKSVDGMEGGNDNFYLLKKDSQRRLTLVKVLQQDRAAICRQWNLLMSKENPDFCLSQRHFQILMDGIRGFIPDQNRIALEAAISKLKEELDFDGAKINQISIALYLFQDAVNSSLRSHSIKPHWMFALDNLVRSAVQSAVTILTPELGAHLADPEMVLDDLRAGALPDPTRDDLGVGHIPLDPVAHEPDGASTSGVSTVNSIPGGLNPMAHVNSAHPQIHQYQELSQVREENSRLLSQLLELQHKYQHLLRHNLVEQRQQLDVLSAHRSTPNSPLEEALLASSGLSSHNPEPTNRPPDEELVDWLRNLDLNDGSVQRFVNEDLTYSDVMSLMSRDDLRRLGLRAGPELRIWKAIQTQRSREIRWLLVEIMTTLGAGGPAILVGKEDHALVVVALIVLVAQESSTFALTDLLSDSGAADEDLAEVVVVGGHAEKWRKSLSFSSEMVAFPSVCEDSCKWRMDQTTGNRMAPQQSRSTRVRISRQALCRVSPCSDSSTMM
eukprot:maker-scaffold2334_size17013-snap-gene-0.5 protein:Tk09279 transcript:maker-scaffold2334_size17013-snap-gene-0.5-mRNA-1 annotation:"mitogen-activated protein kinase kinase kinase 5"